MLDPISILSLASLAIKVAKDAMPAIREAFSNGTIPADQQAKVRAEYESLRLQLGGEYEGSHWSLSGR